MARIACGVEYDGSRYHGWQYQDNVPSIQAEVERALSRVADHPVQVACAGRTDAGVHAVAQVLHFDTRAQRSPRSWVHGANAHLPADISLLWACEVAPDFHARFSARSRRYRYLIYNSPVRPALFHRQVTWNYRPLDLARMQAGMQALVGTHDFSSYRGVHCQAQSPVRTVHDLKLTQEGPMITLEIEANGFLLHMVRNIAGVAMAIGAGRHPPEWAAQVLAARDRTRGGVTAPPFGLYFVGVRYPEEHGLPQAVPALTGVPVLARPPASGTIPVPREGCGR